MTDDEILLLARESGINFAYDSEGEWSGLTDDVITSRHTHKPAPEDDFTIKRTIEILKPFVKAIEQRTLIKQKSKWYLLGAEDERRACAAIVDAEMDEWDDYDLNVALNNVAAEIRARGE
jgi:hypothetical protein